MATKRHILYLIPSAATHWHQEQRVQGNLDLPPSGEGIAAAKSAAETWLPHTPPRTIYTAPDEASRQTADAFAAVCGAKVKVVDDLQEMNLGLWQGLPYAEFKERYPTAYAQWRQDPALVVAPQGETMQQLAHRLKTTMTRMVDKAGSDAVAFVLRPVCLALAMQWLSSQDPATEAPATAQTPSPAPPVPEPRSFDFDDVAWKQTRHTRKTRPGPGDSRRIPA